MLVWKAHKETVLPVIVDTFGIIFVKLENRFDELEIKGRTEITTQLKSTKILWVQENWKDLLLLGVQWKITS